MLQAPCGSVLAELTACKEWETDTEKRIRKSVFSLGQDRLQLSQKQDFLRQLLEQYIPAHVEIEDLGVKNQYKLGGDHVGG
jgi:hypothetical protein